MRHSLITLHTDAVTVYAVIVYAVTVYAVTRSERTVEATKPSEGSAAATEEACPIDERCIAHTCSSTHAHASPEMGEGV